MRIGRHLITVKRYPYLSCQGGVIFWAGYQPPWTEKPGDYGCWEVLVSVNGRRGSGMANLCRNPLAGYREGIAWLRENGHLKAPLGAKR